MISEFTKVGSRQGLRVPAKGQTEKDKVVIDKKAYKELMNYIAKVE